MEAGHGGCAVVVASRVADVAIVTDCVGDARLPAALCGIVCLRPPVGMVSTEGAFICSPTLQTVSYMGRSAEELRRFLSSPAVNVIAPTAATEYSSIQGVRIGIPRALWEGCDASAAASIQDLLKRMTDAGAVLADVDVAIVEASPSESLNSSSS